MDTNSDTVASDGYTLVATSNAGYDEHTDAIPRAVTLSDYDDHARGYLNGYYAGYAAAQRDANVAANAYCYVDAID